MTAVEEYAPPGLPPGYRVSPEPARHLSRLCALHQSFRSQSMIEGITLQDKSLISEMTAKALLEVEAVHFRVGKPRLYRLPQVDFVPAHAPHADGVRGLDDHPGNRLRDHRYRGRRRDGGHSVRRLDRRRADAADAVRAQEIQGVRTQRADRRSPSGGRAGAARS